MQVMLVVDTIDDESDTKVLPIKERLRVEVLVVIIMNFESDSSKNMLR